jgi:catalase
MKQLKLSREKQMSENKYTFEQVEEWVKVGEQREQERIIKLIQAEISKVSNPMLVDREYLDGLEVAIELIKGENK